MFVARRKRNRWIALVLLVFLWTATEGVSDNLPLVSYTVEVNINCSGCGWWIFRTTHQAVYKTSGVSIMQTQQGCEESFC